MSKKHEDAVLKAGGLAKGFGAHQVLKDVTLEIPSAGRVVIKGENGVGKSTLLKVFALALSPERGALELFGISITGDVRPEVLCALRRRIGVVWQHTLLEVDASCLENVMTTALFRGLPRVERRIEAESALEAVGLLHRAKVQAGNLNGGDRKRLGIAQALVGLNAGLLLLDEPTANMSHDSASKICTVLQHASATRRCAIVAITHDAKWAEQFAETHYVLIDGRLIRDGKPEVAAIDHKAMKRTKVSEEIEDLFGAWI